MQPIQNPESKVQNPPVAVLLGGGVESTFLVERFLSDGRTVLPVHVHTGLIWDDCESEWVHRFCEALAGPQLRPLIHVSFSLRGFLKEHWAATGRNVPPRGASSADLELPLRNLTLLGFALHALKADRHPFEMAIGTTADNHYPDGSRPYFDACERVLSLEAGRPIRVLSPLIELSKSAVIRQADSRTLSLSFSCVNPHHGEHCGQCIKCGRRQEAFDRAGIPDPTRYAAPR